MRPVSFTEHYLRHIDKLDTLTPGMQKYFWAQREWHPVVQMTWTTLTYSNGEGLIVYPDNSKQFYTKP